MYFIRSGQYLLQGEQQLCIAGCFSSNCAWLIIASDLPERVSSYNTNALETDNRIWRHASQTSAVRVLVNSPNTDVYHIGLSVPDNKEYIVQLNIHHASEKKYLIFKHLKSAFALDPDLHSLPRENLNAIMQCLYISTGCDYISYIKSFGKATILNIFMQYAPFISGSGYEGRLHHTSPLDQKRGFLSFLHLIGTCYFKKHTTAFIAKYGHSIPIQLFNSTDSALHHYNDTSAGYRPLDKLLESEL